MPAFVHGMIMKVFKVTTVKPVCWTPFVPFSAAQHTQVANLYKLDGTKVFLCQYGTHTLTA
jgi:hypothetical protein